MTHARILIRRVHLWLGLSVGALFVLLGLTGSALVFYVEIDRLLHPEVQVTAPAPAPGWSSPIWDRALATGRARFPDSGGKWSFEVTGLPDAIPARFYPSTAHGSHHGAPRMMVWFSPDGRRIVRTAPWGGYLMSWLYELHMQLLVPDTGRQVVGWSGVAMLMLVLSGVIAWWPRGSWGKALAFKRPAAAIRRLRDLHKLSGLWSAGLLALLVASGILLALDDVKAWLLSPPPVPAPRSVVTGGPSISIATALNAAHRAVPDGRLVFVDVAGTSDAPIRVRVKFPGDPHARFPGSYVFVDRFSGRVLAVHDGRRGGIGTTISVWMRSVHDGSIGGLATRILAVLLGFVPLALFVTGWMHWRRRVRAAASHGAS
ncbi:PepSY-associated TM helix domain-containing protein [uncultured Sphingomonas sp.]|uniref:PepSY-associated TM helix domain-containing protein n=1 Tax=uncultured Sphingomonas sp. TaxID=158754 RepID=UPI00374A516D